MSDAEVTVVLNNVPVNALTDVLLAIEAYAEIMYPEARRRSDPDAGYRYNDLATVILPMRIARDGALVP